MLLFDVSGGKIRTLSEEKLIDTYCLEAKIIESKEDKKWSPLVGVSISDEKHIMSIVLRQRDIEKDEFNVVFSVNELFSPFKVLTYEIIGGPVKLDETKQFSIYLTNGNVIVKTVDGKYQEKMKFKPSLVKYVVSSSMAMLLFDQKCI